MARKDPGRKIVAIDADGRRSRLKAERLEVEFDDGRRLLLDLRPGAWGDLEIEAESADDGDLPVISVQPGACNLLSLRVDVHGGAILVDELPAAGAKPPLLKLAVQKALDGEDKANAPRKNQIRRWVQAALREDAEVTVRLVGEAEGRELNHRFRGKDHATNVLSFAYAEGGARPETGLGEPPPLGDLVLCVPVVLREAAEQGKTPDAHFAHLVVHGMLHLQGWQHDDEADAERMEGLEKEILHGLGYADPYA
jgi:probable rRNA maturation factor